MISPATQNNGKLESKQSDVSSPPRCAVGRTVDRMARWLSMTPLGRPVVPDVYKMQAIDSASRAGRVCHAALKEALCNSRNTAALWYGRGGPSENATTS